MCFGIGKIIDDNPGWSGGPSGRPACAHPMWRLVRSASRPLYSLMTLCIRSSSSCATCRCSLQCVPMLRATMSRRHAAACPVSFDCSHQAEKGSPGRLLPAVKHPQAPGRADQVSHREPLAGPGLAELATERRRSAASAGRRGWSPQDCRRSAMLYAVLLLRALCRQAAAGTALRLAAVARS